MSYSNDILDELRKTTSIVSGNTKKKKSSNDILDELRELAEADNEKRRKEQQETLKSTVGTLGGDDDIAPVSTGKGIFDEGTKWYQGWVDKGAMEDGFSVKNLAKTVLGTMNDNRETVTKAVIDATENLIDAGAIATGTVGRMFSKDFQQKAYDFAEKDLFKSQQTSEKIMHGLNWIDPIGVATNLLVDDTEEASVMGDKSDGLLESMAHMVGSAALGRLGVPTWLTQGINAFSPAFEEAKAEGATDTQAAVNAGVAAVAEVLIEKLSGGIVSGTGADDLFLKPIVNKISNKFMAGLVKFTGKTALEGVEEVATEFATDVAKRWTYDKEVFQSEDTFDRYVTTFLSGAIMGAGGNAADVSNTKAAGRNYATGMTDAEFSVVQKLLNDEVAKREANGKKVSQYQKNKIEAEIIEKMEKGTIKVEEIEEILGGGSYATYKSDSDAFRATDDYKAWAKAKFDEESLPTLQKQYDDLHKMKRGDMTGEQIDKESALKSKIDAIKSVKVGDLEAKLSSEAARLRQMRDTMRGQVLIKVKDSRLAESYRELERSKQAYAPDMTKYTNESAKKTVQNIIDSGLGDNSNAFHAKVELLAKVSADTGVTYTLTKNSRLVGTEHYKEGFTIHGFNENGDIVINMDSKRLVATTAGHEVGHEFQKAGLDKKYSALLRDYCIKKEGQTAYNKRIEDAKIAYKDKNNTTAEIEVANDLLGEYIFNDENFIKHLSTADRNVFQKVYDTIKYMCKIATAGSEEKRLLEKAKHEFEKAWREIAKAKTDVKTDADANAQKNTTEDGGVNYSISKTSKMDYGEQLELIEKGKMNGSNSLYVGKPSDQLQDAGFSDKPFAMNQSDYRKSRRKAGNNKHYSSHAVPYDFFKKMPQYLSDAPMLIDNGTKVTVVTSYGMKDTKGKDSFVIAGTLRNQPMESDRVNLVKSAYPLDDFASQINRAADSGKLVVINKNKAEQMLATIGIQPAEVSRILNLAKDILSQDVDSVNTQYSMSKADAQYMEAVNNNDTETLEKLVDESAKAAGYDIKAYHGTGYDFTVFDKSKQGDNYQNWGRLGKGFYFAPDSRSAKDWAELSRGNLNKVMPVYLRSENMLDSFEALPDNLKDTIPENWEGLTRRLAEKYAYNYIEYMQEFGYDVQKILKDKGYDGINGHVEFVVFDPEQVKSADPVTYAEDGSVIPLSERFNQKNDDIRYSMSKDSEGNNLTTEQIDFFKDSKVVNESGQLKVMYHGTPNGDFTVFKDGTYFTDNKEYADRYQNPGASSISSGKTASNPKTFEVYLNIKKPFDITDAEAREIYINEYIKGGNAMGINPYLSDAEYAKIKTIDWTEGEDLRDFLVENGYDYDGLVLDEGADGGYGDVVNSRGTSWVVFSPEQVKDVGNTKPTSKSNIYFSMSKTVEETKDLMAIHNLHSTELLKQLQMGGMPYPSVAITKPEMVSHDNYGEISLILHKDAIDPKTNKYNKVYSADAYTPTFPNVDYEASEEAVTRITSKVNSLYDQLPDYYQRSVRALRDYSNIDDELNRWGGAQRYIEKYADDYGLKQIYLAEKGEVVPVEVKRTEKQMTDHQKSLYTTVVERIGEDTLRSFNERGEYKALGQARLAWLDKHGEVLEDIYADSWVVDGVLSKEEALEIAKSQTKHFWKDEIINALKFVDTGGVTVTETEDIGGTNARIDEKIVDSDYKAWVENLFDGIEGQSGIRNGKDIFTPSGNRRSFAQTHDPLTIDNIVKVMRKENQTGQGAFGGGSILGASAQEYGSIAEIKRNSDKLGMMDKAEHDAIKDRINDEFWDIARRYANGKDIIDAQETIAEAVSKNESKAGIARYLKQYDYVYKYTDAIGDDIIALRDYIRSLPTPYFEAKPRRGVGFDEVAVFVIPRNADVKLKQELLNRGYNIAEYDPKVEGDRQNVVNNFDEYKFSLSQVGQDDNYSPYREAPADFGYHDPLDDFAPVRDDIDSERREAFDALTDADVPPVFGVTPDKEITTVEDRVNAKIQNTQTELDNNRAYREQSYKDYDEEIAGLQAEYDSLKNKNTLKANNLLRRIERAKRMRGNIDADYAKRISDLEKRLEKYQSPEYKRSEQRRAKYDEYKTMWEEMLGDTSTWKDKALGLSYKTTTMRRFLRDVVRDETGKKDFAKADAIYDELETKYDHHEAQLKRESGKLKESFFNLKLNKHEDTYAHMVGEFRHNPETTLTQEMVDDYYNKHKNHINKAKVDHAIEEARNTFDSLIVRVNEVLKEQGMKEIPYRKGYFPHFKNPKQGFLGKLLNWKKVDTEIPTSIAGLTENFNPERSWQSFNKQRKGDDTDYSLYQGLDTYIHGALDWIYHIEDIQKRRALENYIRYIHSEEGIQARIDEIRANETYDADEAQKQIELVLDEASNPLNNLVTELRARTNTLANKKSSMDRGMEEATNRKIYSTMTNINNRVNANMVVGSLSSALTNFIPMVQSWHQVSPLYTVRGLGDFVRSAVKDDGMIAKSDFLTNRLVEEEKLYQTGWDKVSDKAAFMMNVIDSITSQTVWRSKYLQNKHEGMSESQAIKDADQFAKNLIAGRSRGNQPTIFESKNPLIKICTAFQLEVANQYGYMFKDTPQDSKNAVRLVKGYATAFMGAYLYNALFSSITGRDAAFDPIGIIEDLLRDLGFGDDEEKEETKDIILNFADNVADEMPFISGLTGGGRVPLSSAMPYDGIGAAFEGIVTDVSEEDYKSIAKEMLNPLYYLIMPVGGGQIKKTVEGLSMFSDDHPVAGSYTDSGALRFPVEDNFGSKLKAALFGQWANKNARDYIENGRKPLEEKQIQEYIDLEMPIADYWAYRDGLKKQETLEDKFDYINSLDVSVEQKNIMINNVVDRKEQVDMERYDEMSDYEEFDFYSKNPEKYEFLEENGISYSDYTADEDTKEYYDNIYSWVKNNPNKVTVANAVTDDIIKYKGYTSALDDIRADKDSKGNSISGSAKEKKKDYIFGLDLDEGQKYILFKTEYPKDDTYNYEIIDYLNGRDDISYYEMVTILEELGFIIGEDGVTITWD